MSESNCVLRLTLKKCFKALTCKMIHGPVTNSLRTGTGPRPGGCRPLAYSIAHSAARGGPPPALLSYVTALRQLRKLLMSFLKANERDPRNCRKLIRYSAGTRQYDVESVHKTRPIMGTNCNAITYMPRNKRLHKPTFYFSP